MFLSYENKRGAIIYEEKHLIFQLHCEESGFTRVSLFNEKYGIEIATSKMDLCTVFKRSSYRIKDRGRVTIR